MPFISLSTDGSPVSTTELPSGTYYATSLGLSNELAEHSIEVGITKVEIMDAKVDTILWTNSLLSCFPAFFIYLDFGLIRGRRGKTAVSKKNNYMKKFDQLDEFIRLK